MKEYFVKENVFDKIIYETEDYYAALEYANRWLNQCIGDQYLDIYCVEYIETISNREEEGLPV